MDWALIRRFTVDPNTVRSYIGVPLTTVCLSKVISFYPSANGKKARENEVREHIPVPFDNLFESILSFSQLFLV